MKPQPNNDTANRPTRHLDLGCGNRPRNPYGRDELFGVDLSGGGDGSIRRADLALQPIPFEADSFESVSAYDFLEHVPRVLTTPDGRATRFPFVELMDEIWRVLKPGGWLYASTPVYPHAAAFQDPTHVNVVTIATHAYFTRPALAAAMYGFGGDFTARRVQLAALSVHSPAFVPPPQGAWQRLRQRLRERRGACSHVIWEFEAVKGAANADVVADTVAVDVAAGTADAVGTSGR